MPKVRSRPTNKFLEELVESRGYGSLKEAARAADIPLNTIYVYADVEDSHHNWETLIRFCDQMGISVDEFIRGMLGKKKLA